MNTPSSSPSSSPAAPVGPGSSRRSADDAGPRGWARSLAARWGLFHWVALVLGCQILRVILVLSCRAGHGAGTGTAVGAGDYVRCFLTGLARDGVVAGLLTLPWLFWLLWAPRSWLERCWPRRLFFGAYAAGWMAQVFLLVAEYYFFQEFRSRFNTVAIDYLIYPQEVFINIRDSYPVPAVLAVCGTAAAVVSVAAWRLAVRGWAGALERSRLWGTLMAMAAVVVGGLALNLVPARFSGERLVNELANNGLLSGLAALETRNLDYGAFYPMLPRAEAYARTRRLLQEPGTHFVPAADSIARRVDGDAARPRFNVVLLLEESLGSEFFGSLGRPGGTLTPELDKISSEGLFFVNMFATGNRTVRGFEGVLSSFPPLPGDSIVRRDRSEQVETIARVLGRDGYRTLFLYGGRGVFDGMRAFAVQNGYERFVEQKDFKNPGFTTVWGVCNEELYQRTLEECRELHRKGEPFLATVLSVSNHKPYTYPEGRIPEDPKAKRRKNAVKYTDWGLGQFFANAKKEAFWTNTIFVMVADHGARVYGSQSIPIHSYEIPLLILGPAVVKQPARLEQLGSQLDVAPTILGLLGRPYQSLFFGRDLLKTPADPGRVLLNHNRDIGIGRADHLVVLGLNRRLEYYVGNPKTGDLKPVEAPDPMHQELEKEATAIYQVADDLYMNRRFFLDLPAALPSSPAATPAAAVVPTPAPAPPGGAGER